MSEPHVVTWENLIDWLEGRLDRGDRDHVEAHLASGCPRCEGDLAWLRRVTYAAQTDVSVEPPPTLVARAKALYRPEAFRPGRRGLSWSGLRRQATWTLASVAMLLIVMLTLTQIPTLRTHTITTAGGQGALERMTATDATWKVVSVGEKLDEGDSVRARAEAVLRLHDGSRIMMQPGAELSLALLRSGLLGAPNRIALTQRAGTALYDVPKLAWRSSFVTYAPTGRVSVRGTTYVVSVLGPEEVHVTVLGGQLWIDGAVDSTTITVGQAALLARDAPVQIVSPADLTPAVPAPTTSATSTPTTSPTAAATATPPPATGTLTFESTPSPTPTPTPSQSPSATATAFATPTGTLAAMSTATPTTTRTGTPTHTTTPTWTPTPSETGTLTATASVTPTGTPTHTGTLTPWPTGTATITQTATRTATGTGTATPTGTSSVTPTPTDTRTATATGTGTSTSTATHTSAPTYPPTSTPTRSATPSATDTATATATPTASDTPTDIPSPTHTSTGTPSAAPSATGTDTLQPTETETPTATNTNRPPPAPTPTAPAGSLVLQQGLDGYQGVQDTNIVSWEPDKHFNTFDSLDLRTDDQLAGLFRFDLGTIPADSTVRRALLQVFALERYGPREIVVGAYRVNRDWAEESATWNQPWATAGCNQVPGDRDEFPISSTNMYVDMRWYEFDLTALVAGWILDPGSNHGVVLKAYGPPAGMKLVTSNHGGTQMRPRLMVELTD